LLILVKNQAVQISQKTFFCLLVFATVSEVSVFHPVSETHWNIDIDGLWRERSSLFVAKELFTL